MREARTAGRNRDTTPDQGAARAATAMPAVDAQRRPNGPQDPGPERDPGGLDDPTAERDPEAARHQESGRGETLLAGLLRRHGPSPLRWPEPARSEALALLARSAACRAMLVAALDAEAALPWGCAPADRETLGRIENGLRRALDRRRGRNRTGRSGQRAGLDQRRAGSLPWVGLAASLVLGGWLGLTGLPARHLPGDPLAALHVAPVLDLAGPLPETAG